jgi:hypothetical protein
MVTLAAALVDFYVSTGLGALQAGALRWLFIPFASSSGHYTVLPEAGTVSFLSPDTRTSDLAPESIIRCAPERRKREQRWGLDGQ